MSGLAVSLQSTVVPLDWTSLGAAAVIEHGSKSLSVDRDLRLDVVRGDILVVAGVQVVVSQVGDFTASRIPLERAFAGESIESFASNHTVYLVGPNTGSYRVEFRPIIRGDYEISVSLPAVQEVQRLSISSSSDMTGFFRLGLAMSGETDARYSALIDVEAVASSLEQSIESALAQMTTIMPGFNVSVNTSQP